MDNSKQDKIIFSLFLVLLIASIGATYYRIFIKQDFEINQEQ